MDGCSLNITGNMEKPVVEPKPIVQDPSENVELVSNLVELATKILTKDLVKEVLSGFTTITDKEVNKIKGMITKKVLDKVKEAAPAESDSMKAVDKKSFTAKANEKVNKFLEEHKLLSK